MFHRESPVRVEKLSFDLQKLNPCSAAVCLTASIVLGTTEIAALVFDADSFIKPTFHWSWLGFVNILLASFGMFTSIMCIFISLKRDFGYSWTIFKLPMYIILGGGVLIVMIPLFLLIQELNKTTDELSREEIIWGIIGVLFVFAIFCARQVGFIFMYSPPAFNYPMTYDVPQAQSIPLSGSQQKVMYMQVMQ